MKFNLISLLAQQLLYLTEPRSVWSVDRTAIRLECLPHRCTRYYRYSCNVAIYFINFIAPCFMSCLFYREKQVQYVVVVVVVVVCCMLL